MHVLAFVVSGQCCTIELDGKVIRCKYLRGTYGKTRCSRYFHRMNCFIDDSHKAKCTLRKNSPFDYIDCPYNTNKLVLDRRKFV